MCRLTKKCLDPRCRRMRGRFRPVRRRRRRRLRRRSFPNAIRHRLISPPFTACFADKLSIAFGKFNKDGVRVDLNFMVTVIKPKNKKKKKKEKRGTDLS